MLIDFLIEKNIMEEIGIAVTAKENLDAILKAVGTFDKLESSAKGLKNEFSDLSKTTKENMREASEAVKNFSGDFTKELDEPTKKLITQIRKLSDEGSDDLKKIREAYDQLEKAGGKATKEQIADFRKLVNEYKSFSAQRLEPTQLFEQAAARQLAGRLEIGDLPPEASAPLRNIQQQMQSRYISRMQGAEVDVMAGRAGEFGAGAEAPVAAWGQRMKNVGAFFLGASLTGVVLHAIRHWAMVDKQLIQVEQRLGNARKGVEDFGTALGYTKAESAEIAKIWGEIDNRFTSGEAAQYVGFARHRGIEPSQAMPLRLAGRYVRQQRAGVELAQFEQFGRDMGMLNGRINELISTHTHLARVAADQALGLSTEDIRNVQMFARRVWENVPGEKQRGVGKWGGQFIQKMNAGISQPGSEAARSFLMRAYGFGQGATLTETMERIESGIFGKGNLEAIFKRLFAETPGIGNEERIMALKGLFPQLGIKDIRQLMDVWNVPEDRMRVLNELNRQEEKTSRNFESLGASVVGLGDETKAFMDNLRYGAINDSIDAIKKAIEGDFKGAIKVLTGSIESVKDVFNDLDNFLSGMINKWMNREPDDGPRDNVFPKKKVPDWNTAYIFE